MSKSQGALDGLNVVSLEQLAVVPACSAMMADLGASVIKVEDPRKGDLIRVAKFGGISNDESLTFHPLFEALNRGKRSVALNLATEPGREALFRLIEKADLFMTSLRAGSLKRLGLDYESVSARFPGLVYVTFTGYGNRGPESERPALGAGAFWSRAGFAATFGEPDAPPTMARIGVDDMVASLALLGPVMAALWHRERTGEGQPLEAIGKG